LSTFFEWDEAKNASNLRKHGIRFEEAAKAFDDPLHVSAFERIENGERRWQTYGMIGPVILVMVAHTWQDVDGNEIIRLISARRATPKERRYYEHEND
jgi:uncharacterized DUF497 family protein